MINDPIIRKSIFASVVASLLVILFIQPILNYAAQFFLWVGDSMYQGFSHALYEEAARGLREKYSFIVLFLLMSLFVSITILPVLISKKISSKDRGRAGVLEKTGAGMNLMTAAIVNALVLLVMFFYLTSISFAGFQMNASFNQRMLAIKPYVSAKEYDELRSLWARMKKREDYEYINATIEVAASKANVGAPDLLWE